MNNIQFKCGQCGNLMAVGPALAGKQVRCPHCRQVVLAPAAVPAPEPAPAGPSYQVPPPVEHESIFTPSAGGSDDLFDNSPHTPSLEIQSPGAWPSAPGDGSTGPAPSPGSDNPLTESIPTDGAHVPPLYSHEASFGTTSAGPDDTAALPMPGAEEAGAEEGGTDSELEPGLATPPVKRKAGGGSMGFAFVLIFLIPYALGVTGLAIYFFFQMEKYRSLSPLEVLPDIKGDDTGASRQKHSSVIYDRTRPDEFLPAKLRVPLGQTIQVGDLAVTPTTVERRPVTFRYENNDRESLSESDALVLTLQLKNTSQDDYFVPVDPEFYRIWKKGDSKPYTFLEVGKQVFFGGACRWLPRGHGDEELREYIQGQNFHKVLPPGEGMTTVVCTDPDNTAILKAVDNYQGAEPLLWRFQFRRGLVAVKDREMSACAVIGVQFDRQAIVQK